MNTNPLKKIVLLGIVTSAMALLLSGCKTGVDRFDPNKPPRGADDVNKLTLQDWNEASADLINKMKSEFINKGTLQSSRGAGNPSILAISRFVNNTHDVKLDVNNLIKPIRTELNNTGKMVVDVTGGLGGPEDPIADAWKRKTIFENGGKMPPPDYSLTIDISNDRKYDGRATWVTFSIRLTLTTMDGLAAWEGVHQILKKQDKDTFVW